VSKKNDAFVPPHRRNPRNPRNPSGRRPRPQLAATLGQSKKTQDAEKEFGNGHAHPNHGGTPHAGVIVLAKPIPKPNCLHFPQNFCETSSHCSWEVKSSTCQKSFVVLTKTESSTDDFEHAWTFYIPFGIVIFAFSLMIFVLIFLCRNSKVEERKHESLLLEAFSEGENETQI